MSTTAQLIWSGIIGVAASFIASVIFAVTNLIFAVPRIEIAPAVALELSADRHYYRLKIVNRKRREAVDLHATAYMSYVLADEHGEVTRLKQVQLKATPGFSIMGYSRRDQRARYARRIRIEDDIDSMFVGQPGRCLIFRILARDSFSGSTKLFEKVYKLEEDVRYGRFKVGRSCDIIPLNIVELPQSDDLTADDPERNDSEKD